MSENEENGNPFENAPVIFAYSRAQAIADGVLIDVTETAKEAGFRYPVAITERVFSEVVRPPQTAIDRGESEPGRLWDVLWMCSTQAKGRQHANAAEDSIHFSVFATDERGRATLHQLWAKCGPGDTAEPVVTIMMRNED